MFSSDANMTLVEETRQCAMDPVCALAAAAEIFALPSWVALAEEFTGPLCLVTDGQWIKGERGGVALCIEYILVVVFPKIPEI